MSINLPNQVTIGRLVIAGVFFVLLAQYDEREPRVWLLDVGFILFVVAALTDILDGYLARKYDQITSLGRILDPFVDKILVCGTFVLLAGPRFLPSGGAQVVTGVEAWMVVLILGRELLVTGLRGFSESIGRDFGANVYGKAKMLIQSVTAPSIIIIIAHRDTTFAAPFWTWLRIGLIWLTVIVTTLSMTSYLLNARHFLEASRPKGSGFRVQGSASRGVATPSACGPAPGSKDIASPLAGGASGSVAREPAPPFTEGFGPRSRVS